MGTPLPTTRAFVDIHDAVAPVYRRYVERDEALDEMTRANLLATVDEWDALVEAVRSDVLLPGVGK